MVRKQDNMSRLDVLISTSTKEKLYDLCERLGFSRRNLSLCVATIINSYDNVQLKTTRELAEKIKYKLYEILELLGED